ncbi:hypothetical protein [Butyrivibrio sp. MC2013]|uniref:hypothetical protein n=1 Tax=Butyrivibrio sp. MC2013 TaxID=1280686 RepID=UPI00042303E1|nr:hypothetical protein [Butyrivibrio sp. MC2013]
MDYLEKTYIDNGITYYIDIETLSAELDIRRGKEGIENYVKSLPKKDEENMPSGRAVLDWTKKAHSPRNISQLKCLLDAISVAYEKVIIPESVAFDPEYKKKKIIERQLQLNEKRKRLGLDIFFLTHYLFYFGPYKISPFNMKRVFDGKMFAPSEFLDDLEEVLNRYNKEPVYYKEYKSDHRWMDANDRNLRNRFKVVFPGYELVSKMLRYEYGFNVSRWQLMLVVNGLYSPSPELTSALDEIYNEAKKHVIANNFGSDYLGFEYCEPIEEVAKGDWYVPILLGNDSFISRHFKYKKMEKFCKLNEKRMLSACVHDMDISSLWDIKKAVELAQENFSTVLVYGNWDYVDEDLKTLLCNYSKNHNVPIQYMFKDNRIA